MSRRTLVPALALITLGLAACGSELDVDPTLAADASDRTARALALLDEPWCEPFAARFCEASARCSCDAVPGWPDDCHAFALANCRRGLAASASLLEDAGFLVSTDNVPRCLALVDDATARCALPDPQRFTVECQLVVPRTGASFPSAGQRCTQSGLCARDLRCAFDFVCRTPHPLGATCFSDGDCQHPNVCRSNCGPNGCASTCVAPQVEFVSGSSCGGFDDFGCTDGTSCAMSRRQVCQTIAASDTCRADFECPTGQFCFSDRFDVGPTCHPLPKSGEACAFGFRCGPMLSCNQRTQLCGPPPGNGEPCGQTEMGLPLCADGLGCGPAGLCGPLAQLSEPCSFGGNGCVAGLVCDFDAVGATRCLPPKEIGEQCQADSVCTADAACDFRTFTCQLRLAAGERCDQGQRCAVGLDCVDQTPGDLRCAKVDGEGDACVGICPAGLRCLPLFDHGACVPPMCFSVAF